MAGILKSITMKKSTIHFTVELDDNNVPENIYWDATDKPQGGITPTKSISIAVWDHNEKSTLRIDLWTKDMPVDEMKKFHIDCIGALAQSIANSTGDDYMANEMNALCDRLVQHVQSDKGK